MLKPFHNNLVIEKFTEEIKTATGIIVSSSIEDKKKKEGSFLGKVVSVGPEVRGPEVGYIVVINRSAKAVEVVDGDKIYLVMSDKDVLAAKEG